MSPFLKRALPLLVLFALLLPVGIYFAVRKSAPPLKPPQTEAVSPTLSALAETPDWSALGIYQNTITRDDFERLLTTVFTTGSAWREFIEIGENEARIRTGGPRDFHLHFADPGSATPAPRHWKTSAELPPAPPGKPLNGLHIAIDPGHLGGEWAKIEERWFGVGNGTPVCEGDMTLRVARILKPRLETLGATVSLVRSKPEPVTPLRPADLIGAAKESGATADLQKTAERLFYRTAEIRARAKLVNETLKPDLVLCLHFNAEAWGDPNQPTLVDRSHFHLLLNGAYGDDEISLEDQRFAMLGKLLSHTHEEEARVGATVADTFAIASRLPPYLYPADATNALPVGGNPYLWARNLLANRLYDCPVIFAEPYVMNSTLDYPRIQAGDYEGLREIDGQLRPSIFREYADALADGLAKYYSEHRKTATDASGRIEITHGNTRIFSWQLDPLPNPAGGEKLAASAFIHPLRTPSGFECTTIQPADHLHHFGIWWPWKYVEIDGKTYNCWEIQQGEAAMVAKSARRIGGRPDEWEFANAIEIRPPDAGPQTVIHEVARVSVSQDVPMANVVDVSLHQSAAGSPVTVVAYRYSGFTWRGPASWNKDNSTMTTSEGRGRDDANATPARWIVVSGPTPTGSASILLMSAAAKTAGTPEHLRVWDSNGQNGTPFVNFNPVAETSLPLDEAHPAVSHRRYRIIAADRVIAAAEAEAEWRKWLGK